MEPWGTNNLYSRNQKDNHLRKFLAYDQSDMIETILILRSQPHRNWAFYVV